MRKIPKVILLVEGTRQSGRDLLRGIAKYCDVHNPWMFYTARPFYRKYKNTKQELEQLINWGADGIITPDTEEIAKKIFELGLPAVIQRASSVPSSHIPVILGDTIATAKIALEYLLSHGFKNFAFCGFGDMPWSRERQKSFCQTVEAAGFETHCYKQPGKNIRIWWEKEQPLLAKWLKTLPKPIGLMVCNDDRGRQVIEACNIVNLKVPDEISVLGVDNDDIVCNLSSPSLSSIEMNYKKAGYETARLLDKLMHGEKMKGQKIIISPIGVITRQSTDIFAIEQPEIVSALRFIQQNTRAVIGVNDVADAAAMSRRTLQKKFQESLGRSVHQEIRRARTDEIARVLLETNLSISEIAISFGFSGIEHISRYFRLEKKMSPMAFRKKYANR